MTAKDASDLLTTIRQGVSQIAGTSGVLGKLLLARMQLDALKWTAKFDAQDPSVKKDVGMPAPDSTLPDAEPELKPWTVPPQGENAKFNHPDMVLAVQAGLQALQAALETPTTYINYAGKQATVTPFQAFMAIL